MRDEVMMELVDRAMSDQRFRDRARTDLEETLSEHGYELTPEELGAVREFQLQTTGMSEEEVDRALAQNAAGVGSSGRRQFA